MGDLEKIGNEARLQVLATEIRTIQQAGRRVMLLYSIQIGERLKEAKEKAGHGRWESWLRENTDIGQSTAGNLIKLYEKYGIQQQSILGDASVSEEVMEKLSYTQAVALLGIKDDAERAAFIRENDVADMSKRELEQRVKELKAAKAELRTAQGQLKEAEARATEQEGKAAELEEQLKNMRGELVLNENRRRELEGALADAARVPAEPAVVYDAPPEMKEELESLRRRKAELESHEAELKEELVAFQSAQRQTEPAADAEVQRLRARFELLQSNFNDIAEIIERMKPEKREKYRQALVNVCREMIDCQTDAMADESI